MKKLMGIVLALALALSMSALGEVTHPETGEVVSAVAQDGLKIYDEWVVEAVPVTEEYHGVVPGSGDAPLVETMLKVSEALAADLAEGKIAEVKIAGFDTLVEQELIPAATSAKITALPLQEQILTVIAMMGYLEDVETAISAGALGVDEQGEPLTLSPEAIEAFDEIRVLMEDEAFVEKMFEAFPEYVITDEDGVERAYRIIPLVIVDAEGNDTFERYGFMKTDDGWELTRIYISVV